MSIETAVNELSWATPDGFSQQLFAKVARWKVGVVGGYSAELQRREIEFVADVETHPLEGGYLTVAVQVAKEHALIDDFSNGGFVRMSGSTKGMQVLLLCDQERFDWVFHTLAAASDGVDLHMYIERVEDRDREDFWIERWRHEQLRVSNWTLSTRWIEMSTT